MAGRHAAAGAGVGPSTRRNDSAFSCPSPWRTVHPETSTGAEAALEETLALLPDDSPGRASLEAQSAQIERGLG